MKKIVTNCLLCIAILIAMNSVVFALSDSTIESYEYNPCQEPTQEDISRQMARMERCNQYVKLKNEGRFAEAFEILKTEFPNTATTLQEIELSAQNKSNSLEFQEDSLESYESPMETFADLSEYGLSNQVRSSSKIVNVMHYPQQKAIYCGPAAVQSMISSQKTSGIPTQQTLAGIDYLRTDKYGGTPFEDSLKDTLNAFMITSGEYELGWGRIFTTESLKNVIITTIDAGYPILANGISGADPEALITLPWYPTVRHFVCLYGYTNSGNTIWVCDPAANAPVLGDDFKKVIPKYGYALTIFHKFIKPRGIVY